MQKTRLLNLETGRYHYVNTTGGVMLRALGRAATVSAASRLAEARS